MKKEGRKEGKDEYSNSLFKNASCNPPCSKILSSREIIYPTYKYTVIQLYIICKNKNVYPKTKLKIFNRNIKCLSI